MSVAISSVLALERYVPSLSAMTVVLSAPIVVVWVSADYSYLVLRLLFGLIFINVVVWYIISYKENNLRSKSDANT